MTAPARPGTTGARRPGPGKSPGICPGIGRTAAVLGAVAALTLPIAPAGTAPAAAAPLTTAAPATASGTAAEQPVQISVTQMEPRTVSPDSVITLSGTLSNTGEQTVTRLELRLQRGDVLTTRQELTAADHDPDPDTTVVAPFTPLSGQLEPGASMDFTYSLPASVLQMGQDGVYPVLLNANGTVGGSTRRVGELATYLVAPPTPGTGRAGVAWLWPLTDRTHRDANGRFTDDGLAREVSGNGRLDRVLQVLEQLPRGPAAPDGSAGPPLVPVTVAVDPALLEELEIMAAGPYQAGGSAGTGTQAAAAFLQRLRAAVAGQTVVALPYGDVDADALATAGLGSVLTRSLPGTAAGTAQDPSAGGDRSAAPTTTASPTVGADARKDAGAGVRIVQDALGVRPRTDLAWLPEGPVVPGALTTYQAGGAADVVVSPTALADGATALGLGSSPADARTTIALPTTAVPALVGDTELGGLADDRQVTGGPRIGAQRYLAELALLGMQAPSGVATVLVTPPRQVDPHVADVAAMMTDTTQHPGLQPVSLDGVLTAPAAPAGGLVPATPASTLDAVGMAAVASAVAARDDLAGAAAGDPAVPLASYDAAIARTTSLSWRSDAGPFRAAARGLAQAVGRLRDRVALVAPANGTYSLASNDAPLVLTVRNDLPFAVTVLLQLSTHSGGGLDVGNVGRQTLAPGSRTTLQVPTQVRRSGGFTVIATLTTPTGRPLGDPVQIKVKSTAYGSVSLIITIGAAVLLGVLFLRRLVRFALRRRGGRGDGGLPGPTAEGATVLPPTRSPV